MPMRSWADLDSITASATAHHRFLWMHPFLGGEEWDHARIKTTPSLLRSRLEPQASPGQHIDEFVDAKATDLSLP